MTEDGTTDVSFTCRGGEKFIKKSEEDNKEERRD